MDSHIIRVLARSEVDDSWRQQEMYYQSGLVKNVAAGRNAPSRVAGDLQEGGDTRQQQLIAIECVRVGPYARIHYEVRRQSSAAGNPLLVQSLLAQTLNQRPRKRGARRAQHTTDEASVAGFILFACFACLPCWLPTFGRRQAPKDAKKARPTQRSSRLPRPRQQRNPKCTR